MSASSLIGFQFLSMVDRIKAVVFGFGQDQGLSEHKAAKPAMLFFVKGEATLGLGDDFQDAQAVFGFTCLPV